MNLVQNLELDASLRWIRSLPNPNVSSYVALDGRLGWIPVKGLEISLTGSNLLDQRHPEFGASPTRSEIRRTFYVRMLWNF